jgi:hypothetical protein
MCPKPYRKLHELVLSEQRTAVLDLQRESARYVVLSSSVQLLTCSIALESNFGFILIADANAHVLSFFSEG